jgi:hypothetical protein
MQAMSDTAKTKRGDKQLIALKHMNALPGPDYVFEELTKAIGEETGLDEPGARHLIRYMVKFQDRIADGKNKTLREQGRIICPSWYTPLANPASVTDLQGRHIPFADFPLNKPIGRKTPTKRESEPETPRATPERRATIARAFANFNAKKTTQQVEALATAGAHRFAGAKTDTKVPASENELTE